MRYLALLLVLSIALTGCVRTYTFKKERVDQDLGGNRGYMEGETPPAPQRLDTPKRTMIGVDVELPPYEKGEEAPSPRPEKIVTEERITYREVVVEEPEEVPAEEPAVEEKRGTEVTPAKAPRAIKGEVVEEDIEEEWIK